MKKIGSKVRLKAAYCILQFVFILPWKCNFIKEKSGNLENCMGPFLESLTVIFRAWFTLFAFNIKVSIVLKRIQ